MLSNANNDRSVIGLPPINHMLLKDMSHCQSTLRWNCRSVRCAISKQNRTTFSFPLRTGAIGMEIVIMTLQH